MTMVVATFIALVTSANAFVCTFYGAPSFEVNFSISTHPSGVWVAHFALNTTQDLWGQEPVHCFKSSGDYNSHASITCAAECEIDCIANTFTPTFNNLAAPFNFVYNRNNKLATVWSAVHWMICDPCMPFDPHMARGYFCPLQ